MKTPQHTLKLHLNSRPSNRVHVEVEEKVAVEAKMVAVLEIKAIDTIIQMTRNSSHT